jgi:hypothetical protein
VVVAHSDPVQAAADQLYAADPAEFTDRRADLVAQARADGDKAAARAIGALRRPTRAAWVINQLARADSGAVDQLSRLGDELRAAEKALDGGRLRELSQARRELLGRLTREALDDVGVADPPDALVQEVTGTLEAAVADPQVAALVGQAQLAKAVQAGGFGFGLAAGQNDDDEDEDGHDTAPAAASRRRPSPAPAPPRPGQEQTGQKQSARKRAADERAGRKRAAQEQADRERAERARAEAERQRRAIGEAEQALADADRVVDAAHAAEAERENTVRRLEVQLEDAQDALADAKRRSREARTAQRQAGKVLDRLRDRANQLHVTAVYRAGWGSWQTRSP